MTGMKRLVVAALYLIAGCEDGSSDGNEQDDAAATIGDGGSDATDGGPLVAAADAQAADAQAVDAALSPCFGAGAPPPDRPCYECKSFIGNAYASEEPLILDPEQDLSCTRVR